MRELRWYRGDCLIVAYSDRLYNEVGTIYQACNGLYTGQTKPKNQSNYIINGRIASGWLVRKKYGTRAMDELKKVDAGVVKIPLTRKYRYVFVQAPRQTKAKVLEVLRPFALPYPTRKSENIGPMNVAALVGQRATAPDNPAAQSVHSLTEIFVSTDATTREVRAEDSTGAIAPKLPGGSRERQHSRLLASDRISIWTSPGEY
jgi:hypothetical protein